MRPGIGPGITLEWRIERGGRIRISPSGGVKSFRVASRVSFHSSKRDRTTVGGDAAFFLFPGILRIGPGACWGCRKGGAGSWDHRSAAKEQAPDSLKWKRLPAKQPFPDATQFAFLASTAAAASWKAWRIGEASPFFNPARWMRRMWMVFFPGSIHPWVP